MCETVGGADVCILPGTLTPDVAVDAWYGDEMLPPVDRDGDGVTDDADLCPDIADDQHDEDGDRIGDACDPCPIAKQSTVNTDGDGLPDNCDPFPMMDGDELALFHGFHVSPPSWFVGSGWSFAQDAATFSQEGGTPRFLTAAGSVAGAAIVMTQLTVNALAMDGGIGIGLGTPQSGISCGLAIRNGVPQLLLYDIDALVDRAMTAIPEFELDAPCVLLLVRDEKQEVTCMAATGMDTYTTMQVSDSQPDALQPLAVGRAVEASLLYLLVTTTTSM